MAEHDDPELCVVSVPSLVADSPAFERLRRKHEQMLDGLSPEARAALDAADAAFEDRVLGEGPADA